ncbi:hypothetical protein [Tepidanaerobacter syntrophicus]|uniref:hypothetical protein n=1 Tax=Tepidanaerobacter syntrophicus TaxID=224999 RepID=UPI001BD2D88E|nr:hypothetical protein [Tepidanaerobacter syntrophicus]
MKYIRIQYSYSTDFITIGEYLEQKQPSILLVLLKLAGQKRRRAMARDITEAVLTAADISGKDRIYANIMAEKPKGGRGGLLPGEKEDVLH